MTSPSRRNRRTTRLRAIRRATAISLAWVGLGGTAAAQAPAATLARPTAAAWSPPADAPAGSWSQSPRMPAGASPVRPVEVPPAAPAGTRVMVPGRTDPMVRPAQATPPRDTKEQAPPSMGPAPGSGTGPGRKETALNVFRLSNDAEFNARMLAEVNAEYLKRWETQDKLAPDKKPIPLTTADLPEAAGIPKEGTGYQSRKDATPHLLRIEPAFVVHRPLYFEDLNSERYGWDVGFAQPFLSAAIFAKDTILWPMKEASSLSDRYDTNAGKCPPGSPVPYLAYPPEITLFGASVGAALFVGGAYLVPGR